jgi:hypothetical protein
LKTPYIGRFGSSFFIQGVFSQFDGFSQFSLIQMNLAFLLAISHEVESLLGHFEWNGRFDFNALLCVGFYLYSMYWKPWPAAGVKPF